jgi:PTH1 family peptidyl-tRNA hydrolase
VKLIVGLGNPGLLYAHSRHNIGFRVVKALARRENLVLKKNKDAPCLSAKARISGEEVLLALPLTWMNLSGLCVGGLVEKHGLSLKNLLIVCDDLDLEFGRMRLRPGGSSAGQRGMQSIINTLGSNEFCRLRVGIGRPGKIEASRYVLSRFQKKEESRLKGIIEDACDCCRMWLGEGTDQTMNIFNRSLPAGRQGASKE